jgi:hypothetical protein
MFINELDGVNVSIGTEFSVDDNQIEHEQVVATVMMFPYAERVVVEKNEPFSGFWEKISAAAVKVTKRKSIHKMGDL